MCFSSIINFENEVKLLIKQSPNFVFGKVYDIQSATEIYYLLPPTNTLINSKSLVTHLNNLL